MTDTATEVTEEAPAEPEPRQPCECGCGQVPSRKRSRFMPGHDAQLKSRLYQVIRDEEASEDQKVEAAARLDAYGWPQPAPKRSRAKVKSDDGDGDGVSDAEDGDAEE